jgi:hypothetical protein
MPQIYDRPSIQVNYICFSKSRPSVKYEVLMAVRVKSVGLLGCDEVQFGR